MRLLLLQFGVILVLTISVEYCRAQNFNFREESVKPCGVKNSKQVHVQDTEDGQSQREKRRTAEIIIADFKRDSFGCNERGPKTLLNHKEVRIDLQDSRWFEKNGKRWRNLQLQKNVQRKPGFPTTVATVLIQCDESFPIRYVRNAFVKSMTQCAMVWLEVSPLPVS